MGGNRCRQGHLGSILVFASRLRARIAHRGDAAALNERERYGRRLPLRHRRAFGRRQDEPRECVARARARHPAVGLVHDAHAPPRRARRRALPLRRRGDVHDAARPPASSSSTRSSTATGTRRRRPGSPRRSRPGRTCCSRSTGRAPQQVRRLHSRVGARSSSCRRRSPSLKERLEKRGQDDAGGDRAPARRGAARKCATAASSIMLL